MVYITLWKGKEFLGTYTLDHQPEVGMTLNILGIAMVVKTIVRHEGLNILDVYV